MDVETPEHARIAEDAGVYAVTVHERVAADIRTESRVERMCNLELILKIKEAVSIPVMAKCRIGHFVEAQILEAIGIDFIDEAEALTPADESHHILKHNFIVPFICGARNLGEALRRVGEGAAMVRTQGEPGTGDIAGALRHGRRIFGEIRRLRSLPEEGLMTYTKETGAPLELVKDTKELGRLPVIIFAAGGIATPANATLMMRLGVDGVFVGSGVFKSCEPAKRAQAIVRATRCFDNLDFVAEVSRNLGEPMVGVVK